MSRSNDAQVVAQWRRAAAELEAVRVRDLADLTDQDALVAAEQLLDLLKDLPPVDRETGLVEQQRIFTRAHRRRTA